MRDLYRRLALSPDANDAALREALARCPNSALRRDAEAALSIPAHRERFDALHATVSDVGQLRARLGLVHGAHWQGDVANDFSPPPDSVRSRHDALFARLDEAVTLYNRWQRLRVPWLLIAIAVLAAGVGLVLGLALGLRLPAP